MYYSKSPSTQSLYVSSDKTGQIVMCPTCQKQLRSVYEKNNNLCLTCKSKIEQVCTKCNQKYLPKKNEKSCSNCTQQQQNSTISLQIEKSPIKIYKCKPLNSSILVEQNKNAESQIVQEKQSMRSNTSDYLQEDEIINNTKKILENQLNIKNQNKQQSENESKPKQNLNLEFCNIYDKNSERTQTSEDSNQKEEIKNS